MNTDQNIMNGCEAIRLGGHSCESPSKCHPHVAHVFPPVVCVTDHTCLHHCATHDSTLELHAAIFFLKKKKQQPDFEIFMSGIHPGAIRNHPIAIRKPSEFIQEPSENLLLFSNCCSRDVSCSACHSQCVPSQSITKTMKNRHPITHTRTTAHTHGVLLYFTKSDWE